MKVASHPVSVYHTSIYDGTPTLLPDNVANFISTASLATRLSLRFSSLFLEAIFDAAKCGTVMSLGVSRQALINAFSSAQTRHALLEAPDSSNETQDSGFMDVLERYTGLGIHLIHHTFTVAELFAMSGLQLTSKAVKTSLKAVEESVRVLDGIFGSSETSRAIAGIVTLMHREIMNDPSFELAKEGKVAILTGLTRAITTFAVLQSITHQRTMKQFKMTVLWKGVVVEDEQGQQGLIQFHAHNPVPKQDNYKEVISELQAMLASHEADSSNGSKESQETGKPWVSPLYEITATTNTRSTRTTRIRPIDPCQTSQPAAKFVVVQSDQVDTESFMAIIDREEDSSEWAWNDQLLEETEGDRSNILLAKISPKTTQRHTGRNESYGYLDDNIQFCTESVVPIDHRISAPQLTQEDHKHHRHRHHHSTPRSKRSSVLSYTEYPSHRSSRRSSCDGQSVHSNTTYHSIHTAPPVPSAPLDGEPSPHNFPRNHIINNIAHFMRYASAAYGESFMRILGIGDIPSAFPASADHPNHHAFAHHTGVPIQDILLSSYTDASLLSSMHHPSMHALVHYVAVDHQAKSIVLTCRGTLGLSDILTDLTCGYVDFDLPTDQPDAPPVHYRAHGGMLDAAQRLAAREKGRVFQTIRQGLQRYPDYGLVLCGHSLGGGVVGLLSVIWSERREHAVARLQRSGEMIEMEPGFATDPVPFVTSPFSGLPAGRPIHCYTYGPPCCMSLELSEYCGQGLVTSVVHGYDFVSGLSIGLLKDLKNVAQTLHTESNITDEIIGRLIGQQTNKIFQPTGPFKVPDEEYTEDDQWFWALIKTMRADMTGEKIYPPSTIYHIESMPHSNHPRDPSTRLGAEAHTVVLSRCEDVKARFSEIVFTKSMFMDHSPNVYEKAIRQLCRGFFDQKGAYDQL
ncbi:hypothetical protein CLU79DRAFT_798188 [Phycomyces nitens]|nr:hypothetical protein CLU79DRAFT_798188 [Phycomyces nitens]